MVIDWQTRFEEWKARVDRILLFSTGLTSDDLPDWGYADAFDAGLSPKEAAQSALSEASE